MILEASAFAYEPISELLQWSPTVVVTADALPAVLPWQFHIDWVLAPEGVPAAEINQAVAPMAVGIRHYRSNVMVEGINLLSSRGITDVSIFVSEGVDFAPFEDMPLRCTLFCGGTRWNLVRSGDTFRKWVPGQSFIAIRGNAAVTEGVWAQNKTLHEGWLGVTARENTWVGEAW